MDSSASRVPTLINRLARRALRRSGSQTTPVPATGIPGRFLRVTPGLSAEPDVEELEGSDPTEAAAVRAGWLLIEAHEGMSRQASERVFAAELAAWHAYAETITELDYALPNGTVLEPETKKNRLRFRRTIDFAQPGDRIFDIGFGKGLLAAQLVKVRGIKSYDGIDIVGKYIPNARSLFEINGLGDAEIDLQVGNLYDLTRERIEATGANYVICCEVLEHVPDAEKALRIIADSLPEGVEVLFSVPLHGRLESAWGHVSVFDVSRLKAMLEGAGLYAHHVEPLAATWSIVVASRDPAPSARVRNASGRPPLRVSRPLSRHRTFVDLGAEQMRSTGAGADVTRLDDTTVRCRVAAGTGVAFDVSSLESLRLKFIFPATQEVSRLVVRAFAGADVVGTWTWKPRTGRTPSGEIRVAMRPGEVGAEFVSGPHDGVERADRVELIAHPTADDALAFDLAAAYLP